MDIQWVKIYPKTGTDIQRERERKKYQSRDVRIHANLKRKNIFLFSAIIRWAASWSRLFTYMQITDNIYLDTETDTERKRETRIERRTYTRTINYNIAEQ